MAGNYFWDQQVAGKDDPVSVRIKGVEYTVGDKDSKNRGYDGASFYIAFNDGRLQHTSNLWHRGDVPSDYQGQLQDNARFVTKEEFAALTQARLERLSLVRELVGELAVSDKTFQVWHKERQGFVHAFTVQSKDLAGALIGPMLEPRPAAVSEHIPHARSTTMGDVIVAPNHNAFEVTSSQHGISFEPVDFPPAQRAKLAAEQREDFRMGQDEVLMGEYRESLRMLGEIADRLPGSGPMKDRFAEIMNAPATQPERDNEREPEMER